MNSQSNIGESSKADKGNRVSMPPIGDLVQVVMADTGFDRYRRDELSGIYSSINSVASTDPVTEADSYITAFAWAIVQGFRIQTPVDTQEVVMQIRRECVRSIINICNMDHGEVVIDVSS